MAFSVAKIGFDLSVEGNLKDKNPDGSPNVGNPPSGRKGFEEWLNDNVTTLHDIDYHQSQTQQVVIYE